MYDLDTGELEL